MLLYCKNTRNKEFDSLVLHHRVPLRVIIWVLVWFSGLHQEYVLRSCMVASEASDQYEVSPATAGHKCVYLLLRYCVHAGLSWLIPQAPLTPPPRLTVWLTAGRAKFPGCGWINNTSLRVLHSSPLY